MTAAVHYASWRSAIGMAVNGSFQGQRRTSWVTNVSTDQTDFLLTVRFFGKGRRRRWLRQINGCPVFSLATRCNPLARGRSGAAGAS